MVIDETPLRLFTIVIEHAGDVHVHQLQAEDPQQALIVWAATLAFPDAPPHELRRWRRRALERHWFLEERGVPVTSTLGVWCAGLRLGRRLALLDFVETPAEDETRSAKNAMYTLVIDYLGGTYIRQHRASRAALLRWLERAGTAVLIPEPTPAMCARAAQKLEANANEPRPVAGMAHVWTAQLALGRGSPATVTIVRTRGAEPPASTPC